MGGCRHAMMLGLFDDNVSYRELGPESVGTPASVQLALEAAQQALVRAEYFAERTFQGAAHWGHTWGNRRNKRSWKCKMSVILCYSTIIGMWISKHINRLKINMMSTKLCTLLNRLMIIEAIR